MRKLTLEEIHAELRAQLSDIVRVCDRHRIDYSLMCGSLLGAVRHQGIIPWDDDVDLLMTREEFQRFREVYPRECSAELELTYLDTWTPRVMARDPEKALVFIDIFILDGVPQSKLARRAWFLHLHLLQGMMKHDVDYSRFSMKQKILLMATHVLGLPFSMAWKAKRYERVSMRYPGSGNVCMSNGAFELMMHIWQADLFREKKRAPFEGMQCLIPVRYDEILRVLYGDDYMTPPPEDKRQTRHLDV